MPESPLAAVVGQLVRGLPPTDGTADAALLARFVAWRDEAAFELLVYRHGPMVRGVTRRVLRHEQDAEDAFQATFLALAKRAASVRGQSLAGWLYRVAFHAALKARARSARRDEVDLPEIPAAGGDPSRAAHGRETQAVLDEEVMRLSERFRLPVVLCYLQGRSNSEAAAALGVAKGTIDSRLSTARAKLRTRLIRRGLAPAAAAAVLESATSAGEVPGAVARAVAKAAVAFISHQPAAGVVPAAAAVLADGVLHTMYVTKLKWAVAAVLALAVVGSGAGVATLGALDDTPKAAEKKPEKHNNPPGAKITTAAEDKNPPAPRSAASLRKLLQEPCTIERPIENAPLRDVLEYLGDKYHVSIRIDPAAFARFRITKPFEIMDQQVFLPAGRDLTLADVLRELLSQVRYQQDGGGVPVTFQVKGTRVAIVPAYLIPLARTAGSELPILNPDVIEEQVQGDPVSVEFIEKTLSEALQQLGDATGANIVLDGRCREQGGTSITITLQNVRLFTALRVIADMADLQPVSVGNVYYVTTKENAERLHRQEWPKEEAAPPPMKPAAMRTIPKPADK